MSNPYEIRRELLHQAQNILQVKYESQMQKYHVLVQQAMKNGDDASKIKLPETPTQEDILKVASDLYDFVKKK